MSTGDRYALLSLPLSVEPSAHEEDVLKLLLNTIPSELANTTVKFPIPSFKIGTLDALVRQADELAKLDGQVEAAVAKGSEVLRSVLNDDSKVNDLKKVNDKPVDQFLKHFSWNKVKYRSDRAINELMESLKKEVISLDTDLRAKFNQYQSTKSTLASLERRTTGPLSTRSLSSLVPRSAIVPAESTHLETLLVVVPHTLVRDWYKTYETLAPMVVPRSSQELAKESEFSLFTVTIFKKHANEFVAKARAAKFIPREFSWRDDAEAADQKETENARSGERALFNETIRLGRTAWSDMFQAWIHIKVLRVFVESVLRYGLPLEFLTTISEVTSSKVSKKAKTALDEKFGFLAGNAIGRDSKGRVIKDEGGLHEMAAGVAGLSLEEGEYSPYVYYEFSIA